MANSHMIRRVLTHELDHVPSEDEISAWTVADLYVPITELIAKITGYPVPDGLPSWKTYCPHGKEHSDGGLDQNFRVYPPTNTAACFAMHGLLTPVTIWAKHLSTNHLEAAIALCIEHNLLWSVTWEERLTRAMTRAKRTELLQPDLEGLLKIRLSSNDRYLHRQYDADVVFAFNCALQSAPKPDHPALTTALLAWSHSAAANVMSTVNHEDREEYEHVLRDAAI